MNPKHAFAAASLAALTATTDANAVLITNAIDFEGTTDYLITSYTEDGYNITASNPLVSDLLYIMPPTPDMGNTTNVLYNSLYFGEGIHLQATDGHAFNFVGFDALSFNSEYHEFYMQAVGTKADNSTVSHLFNASSSNPANLYTFVFNPSDFSALTDLVRLDLYNGYSTDDILTNQAIDNLVLTHDDGTTPGGGGNNGGGNTVPEPGTLALLGLGLVGLGAATRRANKQATLSPL